MSGTNSVRTIAEHRTSERSTDTKQSGRVETCPECGGTVTTDDGHGERVCEQCGVVLESDAIDHGPEWRAFTPSEKDERSRVGSPTTKLLHDEGLSTSIGWSDKDASGRTLSPSQREKMSRLRVWDERFRATDSRDRNLKQALGEIDRMASALGLPENVRETASVIYRRALDEDLLPGRSIEGMATASLYAAARQAGTPRSLDEFEPISRVRRQKYARAYRYLARQLELGIAPADPAEYLPRFVSELELSDDLERKARELLSAVKKTGQHSGKNPTGLAAGAIYAAGLLTGDRITQQEVAETADVSEVTIRDRYSELLETLEGDQIDARSERGGN
ncbi:Transcription initiation factor IIB 6 protein [Halorhabdus tiamatea SARL4B]|uniref:Transcription initiation factor IIB n=1 Tax=Halorhabdus tiamatea SARL4B TaxID=1033806 RepID=F7PGT8_9EURY|nr:TFIIB-type zinc ribbon-containing protein [Halorhabdus tiamatea]ERJ06711.1 Transcription initiation factor IIB 6 protein [Halorhabdus tiamatea SARL4B]CCQ33901.1 transcription factor TFIIB cyclin-related protein [Halorhabdus tiamatea SARL4B]